MSYKSNSLTDSKRSQLLRLASSTRREFEQRLHKITETSDYDAKPEGDAICMLVLVHSTILILSLYQTYVSY